MKRTRTQFVLIAVAAVVISLVTVREEVAQSTSVFPDLIQLPAGFGPEGIAVGNGHTFYVGSFFPATRGQILVGDLRTGDFFQLVPPTGRNAAGMKFDSRSNFLFVAGGTSGRATVYDGFTGAQIAFFQFLPPVVNGINDVIVTRDAAYFTDSTRPFLGRWALGPQGQLGDAHLVPLPANFNVPGGCTVGPPLTGNGISATANGDYLILVHFSEGRLYRMDTATFTLLPIGVSGGDFAGGGDVCSADGLLLDGKTLYVVQASLHRVAVVELSPDYLAGFITRYITEPFASNPTLQRPTTIAEFGNSLYAVALGEAGTPTIPKFVVRLAK
jgi:sugar lactone lactonase YvrE